MVGPLSSTNWASTELRVWGAGGRFQNLRGRQTWARWRCSASRNTNSARALPKGSEFRADAPGNFCFKTSEFALSRSFSCRWQWLLLRQHHQGWLFDGVQLQTSTEAGNLFMPHLQRRCLRDCAGPGQGSCFMSEIRVPSLYVLCCRLDDDGQNRKKYRAQFHSWRSPTADCIAVLIADAQIWVVHFSCIPFSLQFYLSPHEHTVMPIFYPLLPLGAYPCTLIESACLFLVDVNSV